MENSFSTIELKSWNEYKKFIDTLSDNWAFRGHAKAEWGLETAMERTDFIQLYKGIEAEFVSEFQRGARNYLVGDQLPEHLIEWLAIMQHHGAPTRLLDFSKSPFIAAYFAFEQAHFLPERMIAIWGINVDFLREKALVELKKYFGEELETTKGLINEKIFEAIFYRNDTSLIFPVEPFRMNRRYSLQQSIFVSTGNSYESFMTQLGFLGAEICKAVIKIEMPATLQKEVLRDLQKMNLNRASLFPDLDGYAASLRLRYNSILSPEERKKEKEERHLDDNYPFAP